MSLKWPKGREAETVRREEREEQELLRARAEAEKRQEDERFRDVKTLDRQVSPWEGQERAATYPDRGRRPPERHVSFAPEVVGGESSSGTSDQSRGPPGPVAGEIIYAQIRNASGHMSYQPLLAQRLFYQTPQGVVEDVKYIPLETNLWQQQPAVNYGEEKAPSRQNRKGSGSGRVPPRRQSTNPSDDTVPSNVSREWRAETFDSIDLLKYRPKSQDPSLERSRASSREWSMPPPVTASPEPMEVAPIPLTESPVSVSFPPQNVATHESAGHLSVFHPSPFSGSPPRSPRPAFRELGEDIGTAPLPRPQRRRSNSAPPLFTTDSIPDIVVLPPSSSAEWTPPTRVNTASTLDLPWNKSGFLNNRRGKEKDTDEAAHAIDTRRESLESLEKEREKLAGEKRPMRQESEGWDKPGYVGGSTDSAYGRRSKGILLPSRSTGTTRRPSIPLADFSLLPSEWDRPMAPRPLSPIPSAPYYHPTSPGSSPFPTSEPRYPVSTDWAYRYSPHKTAPLPDLPSEQSRGLPYVHSPPPPPPRIIYGSEVNAQGAGGGSKYASSYAPISHSPYVPTTHMSPYQPPFSTPQNMPRRPYDPPPLQYSASPYPISMRDPYPNLAVAAGLAHPGMKLLADWQPNFGETFSLKVFRGIDSTVLRIERHWDDERLLRELSKTYEFLRSWWRRWFSLKSVGSMTLVWAHHSFVYPQRIGPVANTQKNLRLRWHLKHPQGLAGHYEFMQVLTQSPDYGVEFVERWRARRIAVAIIMPLVLSTVFGVLWSTLVGNIQDGFTVASYMTSAFSVILVLVGLLNFVEF